MESLSAKPEKYQNIVFPIFEKPKIVGFFSLDGKRTYRSDASQLKFLPKSSASRTVNFDLNHNLAQVIRMNGPDEKLTKLLQFFLQSQSRLYNRNPKETSSLEAATFHCYRGLLTTIASTPYLNDCWRILATLHDGKIYLGWLETQEYLDYKRTLTDDDLKFMSWGFKFEQYMLADSPNGQPEISPPVNENEKFYVVFNSKLGSHRMLYAGEMNGIRSDREKVDNPPNMADVGEDGFIEYLSKYEFVELKTNRRIEYTKQENNFKRYKLMKWWLQSFFVGTKTVICGFRDDKGIVRELTSYNVPEIHRIAAGVWKPNICIGFCDTFLTFVKDSFAREISLRYGDSVPDDLRKVTDTINIHFECNEDKQVKITNNYIDSDKNLPDWFLKNVGKKTGAI